MLKRIFDLVVSFFGLLFLVPFFIIISLCIKFESSGPILFFQNRIGMNGKIFKIFKFRTMRTGSEKLGKLTIGDDERITELGKILRKYKLDELPQLINVFFGSMSLVGPRPEVKEFIDLYTSSEKRKILSVKPGITDEASIEMINENEILDSFDDPQEAYREKILPLKIKHYIRYVENQSFTGDLRIIIKTIYKIF